MANETNDPKKLINWSELSRLINKGGDRNGIRANKIPAKHREKVDLLITLIEEWQMHCGV